MKLIQLNIWQGKILIAVSRFLKEQDPDIICLQEVFSSSEEGVFPLLDLLHSLEALQEELQYPYVYFEPTCTFEVSGSEASFGNAILSKYPLRNKRAIFTNGEYYRLSNWAKEYVPNVRNALICTVETGEKDFTLINHHGYHEMNRLGSQRTVETMQIVANELGQIKGPVILAADLNVAPESPAMRVFDGLLTSLTAKYNVPDTLSKFGKVSDVPCDHIMISDEVKVHKFEVSEALVSDHKALVLEFEL